MEKERWINCYTSGIFESSDRKVIEFIANILFRYNNTDASEAIYNLFANGYCYYFANMLQLAFNRGEVVWHKGFSHIVWRDTDGIAYDIGGVFYDYSEGDLVPLSELGEGLNSFKHID